MCGIFGTFGSVDKELFNAMSDSLRHRGPDDVGFFFDNNVALGNTRLSIIDIKKGHQPIHNEDSTIWITFNGEIYNFQELRMELEKLGHKFYTNSDTEAIVHAYEEWGENCVKKFNGMWAFAIWDKNKKQLFLSRDRLGIKPLYYYFDGKRFIFASEIKAIILDKSISRIPNDRIIYQYLVHGLHDHTEQTFFSQIKKLLPAHNLLADENGVQVQRFWDIQYINNETQSTSINDDVYAERFLELFKDSVRLQLISEVPIGTCLSGGLDSSSIAYMINHLLINNAEVIKVIGERQKTFTACFEDEQIDERKYAEEVIAQTRAEGNFVLPSSERLWEDIKKLVYFQEEPFMSSSVYAQWCVMKLASQKVKVVLDGQGGDELFAGYVLYYLMFLQDLWKKRKIGNFIKELLSSLDILAPYLKLYLSLPYSKRLSEIKNLLDDEFVSEFGSITDIPKYEDLPTLLYGEITKTSLPALLRYEDKNSMALSIEARVPFLDHRLVEYIFSLPITQKLKNGWTKRILRNAMKGMVPEKVRKRRKKIAFATPEAAWLRELGKEIREVLVSHEFGERRYFDQQEILKKFDEFRCGKSGNYANIFWRILNLELWFRIFIDK
jgi:asparagine synthase (glutamine-hydrolysing)